MSEDLDELFESESPPTGLERYILEDPRVCCYCGSREGVAMEPSYTMYETSPPNRYDRALEELPLDPNRDRPLCRDCAERHKEFWDEQWAIYHSSLL